MALPVIIEQDLAASPHTVAFLASTGSVALQGNASELLRTTAEVYRGQFQITATLIDVATQKTAKVWKMQRPASNAVVLIANALARRIDSNVGSFAVTSDRALQLFTRAAQVQDPKTRVDLLRQTIEADPHFGLAYVALLNTLSTARPQAAVSELSQAVGQEKYFTPVNRARLDALRLRLSDAPLAEQARADAAVLAYTPNDTEQLAALASDRYLQGNGPEGDRLIQRALAISLGNASVRQQYARGLIETRRFREAEKVLQEIDNNPSVLADLAFCVLLQGDHARADGIADKFFATVPSPDLKTALHAAWFAISGDIPKAVLTAQNATFQQASVGSVALSQAAVWQAFAGDFAGSQKLAALAQQASSSPASTIGRLLSSKPASAQAWRAKVDGASHNSADNQSKDLLTAYGYFLFGFYPDSVQAWQALLNRSGNTDLPARAMLAASLNRAGRPADARTIAVEPFIPDLGNFYAVIPFTEMRALDPQPNR